MKIIIPCCGKSNRFPNLRPKWMLNMADGRLMVDAAVSGLNGNHIEIIIAILEEHEQKYSISNGLKKAFGPGIQICILKEPTHSQSHTVASVIRQMSLDGPIFIKDADNKYTATIPDEGNYVCHDSLNAHSLINPSNKSYISLNQDNIITRIAEKKVISDSFSVGGYGFSCAQSFLNAFDSLSDSQQDGSELYISHIINYMISEGMTFTGLPVTDYEDWGTAEDWLNAKRKTKTYFVDLDGVVFMNGAEYFPPYWGETEPIWPNVQTLLDLQKNGSQIIFTTSRKEAYREKTTSDLQRIGFDQPVLIMDLLSTQRVLINDYSTSNPFPSADAVNLNRNSPQLSEQIPI